MARKRPGFFIVSLVIVCLLAGAGAGFLRWLQSDLPPLSRLERIEPPIKTLFFSAGGDTLAEFYEQNRVMIPLEETPQLLIDAILAIEDRIFYEHWGVDVRSIVRAVVRNAQARQVVQGASTITQQLACDLFLTKDKSYIRKMREALLALDIEKTFTKDEILEMYMNQIYFGNRAYGIEAAARAYFGMSADQVGLSESAVIAGLPAAPTSFSPLRNPDRALRRRNTVLDAMADYGAITIAEAESVKAEPLLLGESEGRMMRSGYFVEHCRKIVETLFTEEEYMQRGLRVYTTLDTEMQSIAEEAVENHLAKLEKERKYPQTRESYLELEDPGPPEYIQGALIALEPETGNIRAMVGGRSYKESNWNRAVQAPRQPGSAFKLFVFTTALENGYRASDMILDSPVVLPEADGTSWRPHNYYCRYNGLVSLRTAFAKSINLPAAKLCLALGPEKIVETAHRLGIESSIPVVPSIALGSPDLNLLELTTAYSVFRNRGILVDPVSIVRIEDRNGNLLYENETVAEEVIPAALASVMTTLLESVFAPGGTGWRLRASGWQGPAGGKTGTYDNYTNAWFFGFTPEIVTGTWVGFEEKVNMGHNMNGAVAALPIWIDFTTAVSDSTARGRFPLADGVVTRKICSDTGFLASATCPHTRDEYYLNGTEPQTQCHQHAPATAKPIVVNFGGKR